MINHTNNYWAGVVSRLSPELQPAARQALADKQINPVILEAVAKQIEDTAVTAAKTGSTGNAQAIAELTGAVRSLEKRFGEKGAGDASNDKTWDGIDEVNKNLENTRRDLRTLEDKVDTLVPYQLWKVAVVASLAFVIGAVASWNIRPAYKRWQWEQQQREGR